MKNISILKHLSMLEADLSKIFKTEPDFLNKPVIDKCYEYIREGVEPSDMELRILSGLSLDLDLSLVKKAYRKIAMKLHPDKGGDPEKFRAMAKSYKALTDPSFAFEIESEDAPILDVSLGINLAFFTALYGSTLTVAASIHELDSEGVIKVIGPKDGRPKLDVGLFTVRIPKCSLPDDEIVIKGGGMKFKGKRGDLKFILAIMTHKQYVLTDSKDIEMVQKVPLDVLLTGGSIEVPTPFGLKTINVKPGTKPGAIIQIKDIVPREPPEEKMGTVFVEIDVDYPSEPVLKKKPIWQRLGIKWAESRKPRDIDDMAEDSINWGLFEE